MRVMIMTCKTCDFCKRLYKKYCWTYDRTDLFYCTYSEEIILHSNGCDKWSKRKTSCNVSLQSLREAEHDIIRIKQIIDD